MNNPTASRFRWKLWTFGLLALVTLLVGLSLGRDRVLPAAAWFLDVSEPPQKVDVILVLGGGAETRTFVAAGLMRRGLAKRVLVPTVRQDPSQEDGLTVPEHELIRRALRTRGVPDESIVTLPGEVASTRDEARALNRFLEEEPETTVTVVTNGFHTRRARMLFGHELGSRMSHVHFVSAPTDGFNESNWWRSEGGFNCYATEYFKLVFYGITEDHAWQITLAVLATGLLSIIALRRIRNGLPGNVPSLTGAPVGEGDGLAKE